MAPCNKRLGKTDLTNSLDLDHLVVAFHLQVIGVQYPLTDRHPAPFLEAQPAISDFAPDLAIVELQVIDAAVGRIDFDDRRLDVSPPRRRLPLPLRGPVSLPVLPLAGTVRVALLQPQRARNPC